MCHTDYVIASSVPFSQISDTGDAAADFHVLVGIVVDGKSGPFKTDLTVLTLEQYLLFRVLQYAPVILYPGFAVTRQRYLDRSHTNILGQLQGFHQ